MNILAGILPWLQIILAALLVASILLQQNEAGLGSAFGGSSAGGFARAKRGLEKQLFYAAIILALLFVTVSIIALFI